MFPFTSKKSIVNRLHLSRLIRTNCQNRDWSEEPLEHRRQKQIGSYAFIGLSKICETSTFGGVPIAEQRDKLKCGVAIVDLATGRNVAFLEFHSGVEEIFDVQVLPGIRFPVLSGPFPHLDDTQPIWTVPQPTQTPSC